MFSGYDYDQSTVIGLGLSYFIYSDLKVTTTLMHVLLTIVIQCVYVVNGVKFSLED